MTRAFIGLGSNQGDSMGQLERALEALGGLAQTSLIQRSPYYRTAPVGDPDQPDFLNAVAELETGLAPLELLRRMQHIETELGRSRDLDRRWGPRAIDLDLLLFGDAVMREAELVVPHPRMGSRAFVLRPLSDLAPWLEIPGLGSVAELLDDVDSSGVQRVESASSGKGTC